jgi:uncharacterized membrane protein YtjA (UPF0391 family)
MFNWILTFVLAMVIIATFGWGEISTPTGAAIAKMLFLALLVSFALWFFISKWVRHAR